MPWPDARPLTVEAPATTRECRRARAGAASTTSTGTRRELCIPRGHPASLGGGGPSPLGQRTPRSGRGAAARDPGGDPCADSWKSWSLYELSTQARRLHRVGKGHGEGLLPSRVGPRSKRSLPSYPAGLRRQHPQTQCATLRRTHDRSARLSRSSAQRSHSAIFKHKVLCRRVSSATLLLLRSTEAASVVVPRRLWHMTPTPQPAPLRAGLGASMTPLLLKPLHRSSTSSEARGCSIRGGRRSGSRPLPSLLLAAVS